MSSSPPPAPKQLKLACPIDRISDSDLCEIFKHLPPYERLIASEVCRRWHGLSRKSWLDLNSIDLSSIPSANLKAILNQCPNLKSIFALNKSFGLSELSTLHQATGLSSLKLYGCKLAVQSEPGVNDGFAKILSEHFHHAPLDELILHDVMLYDTAFFMTRARLDAYSSPKWSLPASALPATLTKLQFNGLHSARALPPCATKFTVGLAQLQNLTCLALVSNSNPFPFGMVDWRAGLFWSIGNLKSLKELCVMVQRSIVERNRIGTLVSRLPNLEVLVLDCFRGLLAEELADMVTKPSALRILVLVGLHATLEPVHVPARKRFPNGLGADPAPLLHIFLARRAASVIRFEQSSADAAVTHHIDLPMPEFIARKDIAPIFDGVWLAEKIKEAAKYGEKLWDYDI